MQGISFTTLAGLGVLLLSAGGALAAAPAIIPEPPSLALLAAGVGVLAVIRFRKRK